MKLATIIMLAFIIAATIGTIGGTYYSYAVQTKLIMENQQKHLATAADSKAEHIKTFLDSKKGRVIDFSSDGYITNSLHALIDNPDEKIMQDLSNHLIQNKIVIDKSIFEILTLDTKGKLVATSNNKTKLGTDFSEDVLFKNAIKEVYIKDAYFDSFTGENMLTFSAPVTLKDEFLGVIAIKISLEELANITTKRTGLGETGEIYILNQDQYMITPSRFKKDTILKQKVNTINSINCLNGYEKFYSEAELQQHSQEAHLKQSTFLNYQNVPTMGTHTHISEITWCLLAEISESEAINIPNQELVKTAIIVAIAMFLIMIFVGFVTAKKISEPIIFLKTAADNIAKGKLDENIKIKASHEITSLSNSFELMRQEVKRSKEDLEGQVEKRTKELKENVLELGNSRTALLNILEDVSDANEQLKTLDKLKDSLMRDVSHELKTPVTSMQMATELLQTKLQNKKLSKKELKEIHSMIHINNQRLKETINEIMDMSVLEEGKSKLNLKKADLNKIIKEIKKELSPLAKKKGLKLEYKNTEFLEIKIDENKIKRVLINLIGNAIKFTKKGKIKINLKQKENSAIISIEDTGKGINEKDLNLIFKRFYQVDPSNPGPGLGLAISKAIIQKHNGAIWVESEGKNKGSIFKFTVPLNQEDKK